MKEFLIHDLLKVGPGFFRRAVTVVFAAIGTGFFLSLLINVNLGTDPCTFMNVTISRRFGISFGTWQLLLNLGLMVFVLLASRVRYIGLGTLANMVLIGYTTDFFRWVWARTLPEMVFTQFPSRAIVFAIALMGFIAGCAVYMNCAMGVAPYDATPMIIGGWLKDLPFTVIRMCWDFGVIAIGVALGGGVPPIGSFLMALFLGPIIGIAGRWMRKTFHFEFAA